MNNLTDINNNLSDINDNLSTRRLKDLSLEEYVRLINNDHYVLYEEQLNPEKAGTKFNCSEEYKNGQIAGSVESLFDATKQEIKKWYSAANAVWNTTRNNMIESGHEEDSLPVNLPRYPKNYVTKLREYQPQANEAELANLFANY